MAESELGKDGEGSNNVFVKDTDEDRDQEENPKETNLRGFLKWVKRMSMRQGSARSKWRYKLSPLHQ